MLCPSVTTVLFEIVWRVIAGGVSSTIKSNPISTSLPNTPVIAK
ncbi:MAG: hypothetical protein ACTSRO_04340 [Candidatus Heimdallarchaeaceae archaeon]